MSTSGCLTNSSYEPTASQPSSPFAKLRDLSSEREPTTAIRCLVWAVNDWTNDDAILPGPIIPHRMAGASSGDFVRGLGMTNDSLSMTVFLFTRHGRRDVLARRVS